MAANRNLRRLGLAVALAAACLSLAGPSAASVIKFPPPRGPFSFVASMEPIGAAGREPQPVKLNLGFGFFTPEAEAESQQATQLVFGLDRSLAFSVDGLPSCDPRIQIQAGPGDDLAHRCDPARIGGGHGLVSIRQEDGSVIVKRAPVLLVNGGGKRANTHLWLFLHYDWPFPATSFVPVELRPSQRGSYSEEAVMRMPRIAGGSGFITLLELHIARSYVVGGERRGALTLSCPFSRTMRFSAELQRPDGSAARVRPVTETCGGTGGKHLMALR
jgi:hypothetical protein